MKMVDVDVFEQEFEALLDDVQDTGESILVSRDGIAFAELRSVETDISMDCDQVVSAPTSED